MFRVRADDGRVFQAGLGLAAKLVVRVAGGDRVIVHLSRTDPTRARIVEKLVP